MADQPSQAAEPFVVVAGFGLPGRSLVELLRRQEINYCVIEFNPQTCQRVSAGGTQIIEGDASDVETLRKAGVERATLVALMVPSDEVVLRSVENVRKLNPNVHVIARCAFTSSGLEAMRRGADDIIVAEQVVASQLILLSQRILPARHGHQEDETGGLA